MLMNIREHEAAAAAIKKSQDDVMRQLQSVADELALMQRGAGPLPPLPPVKAPLDVNAQPKRTWRQRALDWLLGGAAAFALAAVAGTWQ